MSPRKRKLASNSTNGEIAVLPPASLADGGCSPELLPHQVSQYFSARRECPQRLGDSFFDQPCIHLAKALLGKVLVRTLADGTELRGRVVETEAYLGGEDKASHSYQGKRTPRNAAMFMKPGTIYVYPIYGIYLCMNISSRGDGAAVLLRSLEPLLGVERMQELRSVRRKESRRALKDKDLCNGPSKLCQALAIQRGFDRRDLAADEEIRLEEDPSAEQPHAVVSASRIGIGYAEEWTTKPLRFYVLGNRCVSVADRQAERGSAGT
ncbi:DNA-3-methyladenine glycosylase [Erpetoichthys calabaricus]|uniref:DNA-3-methyladenine glycosylase n=1 Tax=Erpetoichthys calabaricus TaxID=27687 RepID=UPI002233F6D6|nr:DNA-3-methyladenine glycosylase [Erpetoichthys calabaricus]